MSAMKEAFRKAVEAGDKRSYNEFAADAELAKWNLRMAIRNKKIELNQVTTNDDQGDSGADAEQDGQGVHQSAEAGN